MSNESTAKQTLVEEGTEFCGTMKSSCPVMVRGKFDGELAAPSLTVTPSGEMVGSVRAERIHSEGTLAGSVDANDVYLSGTVRSDTVIRAKTLEVKLSPTDHNGKLEVTFGACVLDVGDAKNDAAKLDTKSESRPAVQQPAGHSAGHAAGESASTTGSAAA